MAALKGVKTLDMVDGEITKVSYEGAEYERVEGEAEVGDLVRLSHGAWVDVTPGGFYIVDDVETVDVTVLNDRNYPHIWSERYYVLFRKKHVRLKVGDYAKVVDCGREWKVSKGDFVKVLHDDRMGRPFYCEILSGEAVGEVTWLRESDLVLATEAEVVAAKEAEEKRSIKAKWAKIGRKVGEYKVGDIVAYDDRRWFGNSGIGEVAEATNENKYTRVGATDNGGSRSGYYLAPENLTLITPVEARFDRS
ncbi:hypothetical protein BAE_04370 [Bacillus aerophilus]|nr:hypothetical protein BAE_04370 [Bacillus aerophilus]